LVKIKEEEWVSG